MKLYIKDLKSDTKLFVGIFPNQSLIDEFMSHMYDIVEINESQYLLLIKTFDKDNATKVERRELVEKKTR